MDEREDPVTHETTIINAGSDGDGGGGGATILALIVALLVGIGAFLYFGGYLGGSRNNPDINLNIKAPDIDIKPPNITVNNPPAPSTPAPSNSTQ